MGKRGRPPKKKVLPKAVPKAAPCYTISSSDEDAGKKEESVCLPSPTQRRGVGNERSGTIVITPPDRTIPLINGNEKKTTSTRNSSNKKKIILNGSKKKDDTSGDSDATEVYVYHFFICLLSSLRKKTKQLLNILFNRYSVSNDDDEDYIEKTPKVLPTKRKRKAPAAAAAASIKVNHDLSENSDDDLTYSRRSITIKPKRRTPSSSSISSADSQSEKRTRPPIPTFKRAQDKKKKKNLADSSDAEEIIATDEDYDTDVEKMDDKDLIKKTERRMLKDEDLTQMTKKALEDEKQRVQRIQERQSQLPPSSQIVIDDDSLTMDNNTQKKDIENEPQLVFEFESNTNEPLIAVHPELIAKMKPHQLDGTMFLWENVYESIAQIKRDNTGTGCILAHHMGL